LPKRFAEDFYAQLINVVQRWSVLETKLSVDGEEIPLNEFVNRILGGTVVGAVTSLRGISETWEKIEIRVTR
jgi:hypothetical protein